MIGKLLHLAVAVPLLLSAAAGTGAETAGQETAAPAAGQEKKPRLIGGHPSVSWLIYIVAPQTLCSWNDPRTGRSLEIQKQFIRNEVRDLPEIGSRTMGGMNTESMLTLKPTAIITADFVRREVMSDSLLKNAGIETVNLNFDKFEYYPDGIRAIAKLAGTPERGERLAVFFSDMLTELNARVGSIPEEKRLKVYYAGGINGLETAAGNNVHDHIISYAGGKNAFPPHSALNKVRFKVSFEQLLEYDPDVIVISTREFANNFKNKPGWSNLRAVKNGRAYLVPDAPVSWIDRPVSVFQLMGAWWLAAKLYPDKFPEGYRPMAERFFAECLQVTLDEPKWNLIDTDSEVK